MPKDSKNAEINADISQTSESKYVIVNNNNFQIIVDTVGKDNAEDTLIIGSKSSETITTEYLELSKILQEQYGNTVSVIKL